MTNGEKYKTAKERSDALNRYCETLNDNCSNCPLQKDGVDCQFVWLELEVKEEETMPCPFCGHECVFENGSMECTSNDCYYSSGGYFGLEKSEAIAAHNRVCKAVAAYKESEVKE